LVTFVSPAETIEMPFWEVTHVGPRNNAFGQNPFASAMGD